MKRELIDFQEGGKAYVFMVNEDEAACPVCGYAPINTTYGPDGSASFEYCPDCQIEFGFDDHAALPIPAPEPRAAVWQRLRAEWISARKVDEKLKEQLLNIGVVVDDGGNLISDLNQVFTG